MGHAFGVLNSDVAPWDVLLTDDELKTFFRQLAVVATSDDHVVALYTHYADAGRLKLAMEAAGYNSVHPVYTHKP